MDLNTLLAKWHKAKENKKYWEIECNNYRDAVKRYMDRKQRNTFQTKDYIITRRSNTRTQLLKADVPKDVWEKYSSRLVYSSYTLKKVGG